MEKGAFRRPDVRETPVKTTPSMVTRPTAHQAKVRSVVNKSLVKRVKKAKARRMSSALQYRERSEIAFIVHSFNRVANVNSLFARLRRLGNHELIVCEDGSMDGSCEKWLSLLRRPNDFLIRSNDVHEIRILDRAIRFARSDIICLVQDDDHIPADAGWLTTAMKRFKAYENLAIMGGFMGFRSFDPHPERAKRIWGPAPFQFVHHVNIGPYFIRKQHYEAMGGWDHSFSRAGEPGICFDNELCLRAWINGYQVGYSFVPFKGRPGQYSLDGGTMLFSAAVRRRNQVRNQRKIFAMYAEHTRRIERLVREANRSIASPDGTTKFFRVNNNGKGGMI